ncbi:helix-turn-helix transcriptional regulator [Solibacillus sp. FSL K6-1554]|uniref:helix-turn-helix transcriptional regulator n=1 Tax=Solibacillus sp. FSL K6-1554 TaxID=2921472 RepID=UPI0030F9CD23
MNRVREFRKLQKLTQIELAKQIGIARQTLNMIENNKYNPTLALCISLAKALHTDLNTLFWEVEKDEEPNI